MKVKQKETVVFSKVQQSKQINTQKMNLNEKKFSSYRIMCVTSGKNLWIRPLLLHMCCFLRLDCEFVWFLFWAWLCCYKKRYFNQNTLQESRKVIQKLWSNRDFFFTSLIFRCGSLAEITSSVPTETFVLPLTRIYEI